jgi:hypothetical protein
MCRRSFAGLVGLIVLALVVAVPTAAGQSASGAEAGRAEYDFTTLASIGDPAPGGGNFTFDFEPGRINDRGEAVFAADLTTRGEGIFLARNGNLTQVLRSGQPAPGGGTFGSFGVFGPTALNDTGDVAAVFALEPSQPLPGLNAGVYRVSHLTNRPSAVVVPDTTPAPGGGVFKGALWHATLNNQGAIAFAGIVPTTAGISGNLGVGVFQADATDRITRVAAPGDPEPGGGKFDFAQNPWINDVGDVAFGAHVSGEPCIDFDVPQSQRIFCAESVYVRERATGTIRSIAHQGAPAPGGGVFRLAFGPVVNNRGEILFIGDLTPAPGTGTALGVFLHTGSRTISVARPGDPLPGGGSLAAASFFVSNYDLNDRGDIAFNASLDTGEQGLYVRRSEDHRLVLVAKTRTQIPGVGTIQDFDLQGQGRPSSGAMINNRGQVLFGANLTNGSGVVLVATP